MTLRTTSATIVQKNGRPSSLANLSPGDNVLAVYRTNGTDPSDPAVQALVTRSGELIQMFTGGDPGIAASLKRMYEQEGPQRASRGFADPEDMAYLEQARASRS